MKNLTAKPGFIRALCAAFVLLGPLESKAQPQEGSEIEIGASVLNFGPWRSGAIAMSLSRAVPLSEPAGLARSVLEGGLSVPYTFSYRQA